MENFKNALIELKPILRTGLIMAIVVLAVMFLMPPSDYPLDYEDKLRSVESSYIKAVGHDFFSNVLVVEFKESDKIYAYYDVPRSEYKNMIEADSVGKYFNERIKGDYEMRSEEI